MDRIKNYKFKYFIAIAILLFAFEFGICIPFSGIGRTPFDAISSRFNNELNIWRIKRVVSEVNLKNRRLVFYENYNGNIMVSLLKKKWNGMWKVIDTSGEMASAPRGSVESNVGGAMHVNFDGIWVNCGVIYNDKVEEVKLNGIAANILDEGLVRMWYLIKDEASNKYEVEAFDYNGGRLD